ncbi:CRISPR-associated protein Cas4 [soil metagenome]
MIEPVSRDRVPPASPAGDGEWDDSQLVPLSALQHYAYCPRQCALIHVEQVWDENLYTLRGRRAHERVDESSFETREGVRTEYALPLFSDELGLVGKADAVEIDASGTPYPVEHKVGKRSKGKRARHADAIQLCAQGLCLEDMLDRPVPAGALSYRASRRRLEVKFTPELRAEVERVAADVRRLLNERSLPLPVADDRCRQCSLIETCMPFITQHFDFPDEENA